MEIQEINVEVEQVNLVQVTNLDRFDHVLFGLQDIKPGHGRLMLIADGHSWSDQWNAMGVDRSLAAFLRSCDSDYLAGGMMNGKPRSEFDWDELSQVCASEVDATNLMMFNTELAEHYGTDWLQNRLLPSRSTDEYTALICALDIMLQALRDTPEGSRL